MRILCFIPWIIYMVTGYPTTYTPYSVRSTSYIIIIICTRSEPGYWDAKVRSKEKNKKQKVLYSTVNYIETSESQFNPARRDRTCLGSYIQLHFSF